MSIYIARALSSTAAVNALTAMTALGGETPPATIPLGVTACTKISAIMSQDGAVVASVGAVFHLRIGGQGVPGGPHDFILGAVRVGASETGTVVSPALEKRVNFPVTASGALAISAEWIGTDTGTQLLGVELEFT